MATVNRNPTSDDAVSGTWDGTPGSRYTVVDDHPDSGGTDFLTHGTTTAGNLTFGYAAFSVPAGSTSISVQVIYYDRKNASQGCNIGGRLKVGGSYYNAATHNPTNGSWVLRTDNWATNPAGGSWTVDQVNGVGANALQAFGWVSTDANPAITLSSIIVQVTYTPPKVALAGVSAGVATVSGAIAVKRTIAGVITGVAVVTGATAIRRALATLTAGVGTVAGALGIRRALGAIAAGVAAVTGLLGIKQPLAGTSAGIASVTGALTVRRGLSGSSAGTVTVSADLSVSAGQASTGRLEKYVGLPAIHVSAKIEVTPLQKWVLARRRGS